VPWTQRDVDWFAARLMVEAYDINKRVAYDRNTRRLEALYSELTMRRRLTEPAMVDGVMRPAGFEFDDNSAGPHRRTGDGFAYHPQFVNIPAMSAIDRLKEKALQARQIAPDAIKAFEADLDSLIAEGPKLAAERTEAVSVHAEAFKGIRGEIGGLRDAMDILSNGAPDGPLPGSGDAPKA